MKDRLFAVALIAIGATVPFAPRAAEPLTLEQMKALYVRPVEIPFPADNPYSVDKAKLGEMLFFDPRLSGANYISCATCHNPSFSWSDGLPRGIGHGMTVLGRRTPTILNEAWSELLMWDGRKDNLEDQAIGPVSTPTEMNQDIDKLVDKLGAIDGYRREFARVFPGEGLTVANIAKALATYQRTIVSGTAPFDKWIDGDERAISDSAKRGFVLFNAKGNCAACHSGWNFTDGSFRDIGLPDSDVGRANILALPSMVHAFKTPTLRDIDRRAPYMHDGSQPTLAAVIEHYDHGVVQRPSVPEELAPQLHLSAEEKADLVAFLETLTGEAPPVHVPVLFAGQPSAQR
jgi:cytochrome c peroxidase